MAKRITISLTWYIILAATSVLILSFTISGIVSYTLYKKVLATETLQKELLEKQTADRLEQEEKAKTLIDLQQRALTEAQVELSKTKTEAAKTSAEIKTLSQTVKDQSLLPKDIVISSSDLAPYMTGVVQVICANDTGISSGSGSLWKFKEVEYAVLTNYHVVKDATKCAVSLTNSANETIGIFSLKGSVFTFNKNTDEAVLSIGSSVSTSNVPVANYNYALSNVRKCQNNLPVGSPVVIAGYPAYAKRDATLTIDNIGTVNVIYRTATNGIISGYDSSQPGNPNYFVSAKIDNGNSGGIALAKDSSGICVLGLPTWLTVGNYETQGLVQNITNVLPNN